ncbi:ABC transporter ATP-binding protein [Pseudogracilibacillus auburnensis]|uniref:ABC transporter ATP-binding protein n=1 Tax=Pseudogracilibacillus auburnensis TaxID=1494959 RepID=UPI000D765455|nr:betaine/proline/choline family ABC transporter ATP-binding protein [Pseudogracilibacillus auburnensis]MBO1004064.1 betaine/proline/choline family ABC transporter ATP-binding protein [Pseudogracilibacillus auburnensis]
MISFEQVSKRFSDGTEALKDVSVTIPTNKLTAIIGPSGCGKTTLMKMVNRLETPTSGEIYIDEQPVSKKDPVELRRSIGYVIQRIGLIPHMTIAENVALVPELLGWKKAEIKERVNELLYLVDLEPETFKKRYPLELSGGQQQRVGVSRALASDPNIILMDEPFSALDPISREQLQYELKKLQRKIQKTIVFVTHDMDEALDIADVIIVMRDGQIEQMATPAELLANQVNEFVREFIGIERINRKRDFGEKQLKEFQALFEKSTTSSVQPATSSMTMRQAIKKLDQDPDGRLEVMEDGAVLGYVGYHTLLQAAIQGSEQK